MQELLTWSVIWLIASVLILVRHWHKDHGIGLLFGYILSFGMLHWVGTAVYLLPWYDNAARDASVDGLRMSAIALISLGAGAEVAYRVTRRYWSARKKPVDADNGEIDARLPTFLLVIGIFLYVALSTAAGKIPTLSALTATGSTLIIIAIALHCWKAWHTRGHRGVLPWLGVTSLFPIVTVIFQGFLGYGFAAILCVFTFVASFYRPRRVLLVVGIVLTYFGMSVYVTYMRDRTELRSVVWYGGGLDDRFARLGETAASGEWFDPRRLDHLDRINSRLNQNFLVGASISYIDRGLVKFAGGTTFRDAVYSVIPRALWPDKPIVAGSGDLASIYTGIFFGPRTSIGIGQVMECYINFGTAGVILGFLIIGMVLVGVDRVAARRLGRGDAIGFLRWYMPGLSLLQIGGSFVEVTATAAAGIAMSLLLKFVILHTLGRTHAQVTRDIPLASGVVK